MARTLRGTFPQQSSSYAGKVESVATFGPGAGYSSTMSNDGIGLGTNLSNDGIGLSSNMGNNGIGEVG